MASLTTDQTVQACHAVNDPGDVTRSERWQVIDPQPAAVAADRHAKSLQVNLFFRVPRSVLEMRSLWQPALLWLLACFRLCWCLEGEQVPGLSRHVRALTSLCAPCRFV